jgi:hypothetical protein
MLAEAGHPLVEPDFATLAVKKLLTAKYAKDLAKRAKKAIERSKRPIM